MSDAILNAARPTGPTTIPPVKIRALRYSTVGLGVLLLAVVSGCQYGTHAMREGATGAGVGALIGAFFGHAGGKTVQGALIGAAAGGAIGGVSGASQDLREKAEEDAAQASYKLALDIAMRNADVLEMVATGMSDEVIISSIRNTVTLFDLSPEELSRLKTLGVSDEVLMAMQKSTRVRKPATSRSIR